MATLVYIFCTHIEISVLEMECWAKGYVVLKFDIDKLPSKKAMAIYSPNSKCFRVPVLYLCQSEFQSCFHSYFFNYKEGRAPIHALL